MKNITVFQRCFNFIRYENIKKFLSALAIQIEVLFENITNADLLKTDDKKDMINSDAHCLSTNSLPFRLQRMYLD